MSASELSNYLENTRRMGELLFQSKLELFEEQALSCVASGSSVAALTLDGNKLEAGAKRTQFLSDADEFVYNLFRDLPSGLSSSSDDSRSTTNNKNDTEGKICDPFLYGEIAPEGISSLILDYLLPAVAAETQRVVLGEQQGADEKNSSSSSSSSLSKFPLRVSFVDLGSGVGKATMEIVLTCAGIAEEQFQVHGLGVELHEGRHTVAAKAHELATGASGNDSKATAALVKDRVRYFCQDMLSPLPDEDALGSVFAFCCGVAFDKEMCARIVARVLSMGRSLLGAIFLFKEWPFPSLGLPDASSAAAATGTGRRAVTTGARWTVKKATIATTWMNEAPCFVLTTL